MPVDDGWLLVGQPPGDFVKISLSSLPIVD
jgi:hypothetical protein